MRKADPPMSVTTLRLDPDLMERVRETAQRNRRTLSGEIAMLIEEALETREDNQGARATPFRPGRNRRAG
jgi:hypothetical protein